MMSGRIGIIWVSWIVWIFSATILWAQEIPQREITELKEALKEAGESRSSTRKRLAYKRVIRDGEGLIKDHAEATNRWEVLAVLYHGQRKLFELDDSNRNREALFDICETLRKAPDDYADLRLDADLLLMERNMSAKNADVQERATELTKLLQRYKDTPGESRSLQMGLLIAPKLDAFELEKEILRIMDERFAGDYDVVIWRRKHQGFAHYRLLFTGEYTQANGTKLVFPIDGVGKTLLLFFWSKDTPETEAKFAELKDMQERIPEQFQLLSFNLDELPDNGQKILKEQGLNAISMRLPGGRKNKIYQVYSDRDPFVIRVNAHGHAFSPTKLITEELKERPMEENFDDERYLAQIQSLVNGDFLVGLAQPAGTIPAETLSAIKECWRKPPFRFRLTSEEAFQNYQKAQQLCDAAIQQFPYAADLWQIRNLKILALIGMWKSKLEPAYLETAATESKLVLEKSLPLGADVIPKFCLVKQALRQSHYLDWSPIREFVQGYGEKEVPPQVYALAAMMALEMNARELFDAYTGKLLEGQHSDAWLWPVLTFLNDPNHRYRLFKSNFYLPPSLARRIERAILRTISGDRDRKVDPNLKLEAEFKTLAGETFQLPVDGKTTLLMFLEPPADPEANFPATIKGEITIDTRGKEREFVGAMQRAFNLVDQRIPQNMKVVAAFLSEDAARVKALTDKNQWACQAVMVPGGLQNPIVRQFGILSADRLPNVLLLKPDGTVVWQYSGNVHPQVRAEGNGEMMGVFEQSLKWNILKQDMERALQAFETSTASDSIDLFTDAYPPPSKPRVDAWSVLRHHGRAVTLAKASKWEEALNEVDTAIESHELIFNRKKPSSSQSVGILLNLKADALEQLGKGDEAIAIRERAKAANLRQITEYYRSVHQRLERLYKKGKVEEK